MNEETIPSHHDNMMWLLSNPESDLTETYHDQASCWELINEFRTYYKTLASEINYLGSQIKIIQDSFTQTIQGNPEEQKKISIAAVGGAFQSDDGEIL